MLNILQITRSYYLFPIIPDVFETGLFCSLMLLSSRQQDNNISSLRNNLENLQIK